MKRRLDERESDIDKPIYFRIDSPGTEWPLIEALLKEGRGVTVFHSSRGAGTDIHSRVFTREKVPGRRSAIKETEISRRSGAPVPFVNTTPTMKKSPLGLAKLARKQKMYPPYLRVQRTVKLYLPFRS